MSQEYCLKCRGMQHIPFYINSFVSRPVSYGWERNLTTKFSNLFGTQRTKEFSEIKFTERKKYINYSIIYNCILYICQPINVLTTYYSEQKCKSNQQSKYQTKMIFIWKWSFRVKNRKVAKPISFEGGCLVRASDNSLIFPINASKFSFK